MKKRFLALALALAALLALACPGAAAASAEWDALYTMADPADPSSVILASKVDSGMALFLPASMSLKAVPIYFKVGSTTVITLSGNKSSVMVKSGDLVDLTRICGGDNYTVTAKGTSVPSTKITFMRSDNVAAMFLTSDDPKSHGRAWVEASASKSNKATGSMVMLNPDGTKVYNGTLTQIKGRGNTTWLAYKRPYQIKLGTKTDLLETGVSANRAKTWILLANYYDPSYLRNTIMLELARAMGMEYSMEQRSVALYYDGEYRGLYQLTEKVEIKTGRLELPSLDDANEAANPSISDFDATEVAFDYTSNGAMYAYRVGVKSPEDITGGYLLEMDFHSRAASEGSYFETARGDWVAVKSPEYASKEEMEYIATLYQHMEDALYAGGTEPGTGKPLTDYLDLHTAAQVYVTQELAKNQDAFVSSSFLYKRPDSDVLYAGPLWDFDLCLGNTSMSDANVPENWVPLHHGMGKALNQIQSFRAEVEKVYFNEALPALTELNNGGFDALVSSLRPASLASQTLWNFASDSYPKDDRVFTYGSPKEWKNAVTYLGGFLKERTAWLSEQFKNWAGQPPVETTVFIDVQPKSWYYADVNQAYELGLVNGAGAGRYYPNNKTTRAEAIQVLYNMAGSPDVTYERLYHDVNATVWYSKAVTWGSRNGIVYGNPEGYYMPNAYLSRQDLAAMLYRTCGSPQADLDLLNGFLDAAAVSSYAKAAMAWAVETGIIRGDTNGFMNPKATATRAELAAIMVRYYDLVNAEQG